jgi:hypothetical protein
MGLRFRPQPGKGCRVSRSCFTVCRLNALDHFFHSQKVQHAGIVVGGSEQGCSILLIDRAADATERLREPMLPPTDHDGWMVM